MIYLASAYYHENETVREANYLNAMKAVHYFALKGLPVFSPILHFHELSKVHKLPKDHKFWRKLDEDYLSSCAELYVLCTDNWERSVGVQSELIFADTNGITPKFFRWNFEGRLIEIPRYKAISSFPDHESV